MIRKPPQASTVRPVEISSRSIVALVHRLVEWFVVGARDLPWRNTLDPYAIWVSEIMLQQTQVRTVIPYFERWMRELPDISSLASVSSERLHKLWEGLGYYSRARNLQKAAQLIIEWHQGRFPANFDAILALPGVGRYTAGAITSIAFNQPNPIVDGNVVRVLARLFKLRGDPKEGEIKERFWSLAERLVERSGRMKAIPAKPNSPFLLAGNCSALNQALMELGATICTPANPRCGICPLNSKCLALAANQIASFPQTAKRAATVVRRFVAFVIRRGDRLLLRQRPSGVVNAHLWELPNAEISISEANPAVAAAGALRLNPGQARPLGVVRHHITRNRITLECFEANAKGRIPKSIGIWTPLSSLEQLAFTGAHVKLLKLARLLP